MEQTLLNWLFGVVMALFGFLVRVIWDATEKLKADLNELEVKLPETYAMKSDIEKRFDKIDTILQRIYEKLDGKQDRVGH